MDYQPIVSKHGERLVMLADEDRIALDAAGTILVHVIQAQGIVVRGLVVEDVI